MKPLHVTIDYPDDIESAGGWYGRRHVEQTMARFKELGITRVYWISYHDSFVRDRLADEDTSLTQAVVDAGHAAGLEVYALFKPFEMGLYSAIPHSIPLPDDVRALSSPSGMHPRVCDFVLDHPEMRMKRRRLENAGRKPGTIKLVKADAEPTRLTADDLEIWTSHINGDFARYDGPREFSDGIEQREGVDCRVLTFAGLQLPGDARYILVKFVDRTDRSDLSDRSDQSDQADHALFTNTHDRIMEVCDKNGYPMAANHDEGPMSMDIPRGQGSLQRNLKMLGLWKHGDPERYCSIVPDSYGKSPETFGYAFFGDYHKLQGQRALDGNDGRYDGYAVRSIWEKEHLCGALHPCYPEVRQYWLSRIQACIDAGMDGVDIRICNHSSWTPEGENYGFNEPAVAEFKKRHGVNVLEQDFDMNAWKDLQHEYWMTFLREARALLKNNRQEAPAGDTSTPLGMTSRGSRDADCSVMSSEAETSRGASPGSSPGATSRDLKLQLHVTSQLGKNIWKHLNNVPGNFNWDWQRWIKEEDLCDAIHLKWPQIDLDFAGKVAALAKEHGKEVTFSLRMQYPLMSGEQDAVLSERLQWAQNNDNVDAVVLYEKDCFTELDKAMDEVVIVPGMKAFLVQSEW